MHTVIAQIIKKYEDPDSLWGIVQTGQLTVPGPLARKWLKLGYKEVYPGKNPTWANTQK